MGEVADRSLDTLRESVNNWHQRTTFVHFTSVTLIDTTHITETLIDLTNETRSRLHEVEDKLWVLWVAAQQVNARQKVEVSIR